MSEGNARLSSLPRRASQRIFGVLSHMSDGYEIQPRGVARFWRAGGEAGTPLRSAAARADQHQHARIEGDPAPSTWRQFARRVAEMNMPAAAIAATQHGSVMKAMRRIRYGALRAEQAENPVTGTPAAGPASARRGASTALPWIGSGELGHKLRR